MDRRAGIDADAGNIAPGSRQGLYQPRRNGITGHRNDWQRRCFALEKRCAGANDIYDVRFLAHHLGDHWRRPGYIFLLAVALDDKVLALDVPEASQFREQCPIVAILAFFMHQRRRFGQAENSEAPQRGRLRRDARNAGCDRQPARKKLASPHATPIVFCESNSLATRRRGKIAPIRSAALELEPDRPASIKAAEEATGSVDEAGLTRRRVRSFASRLGRH